MLVSGERLLLLTHLKKMYEASRSTTELASVTVSHIVNMAHARSYRYESAVDGRGRS